AAAGAQERARRVEVEIGAHARLGNGRPEVLLRRSVDVTHRHRLLALGQHCQDCIAHGTWLEPFSHFGTPYPWIVPIDVQTSKPYTGTSLAPSTDTPRVSVLGPANINNAGPAGRHPP